mmetsp:Transcript_59917/g.170426  ORF Transcript_59917/g.170426 Transcript_59917/m.170426 type:complete len:213 (+) Transcript_59917:576-1214(+)
MPNVSAPPPAESSATRVPRLAISLMPPVRSVQAKRMMLACSIFSLVLTAKMWPSMSSASHLLRSLGKCTRSAACNGSARCPTITGEWTMRCTLVESSSLDASGLNFLRILTSSLKVVTAKAMDAAAVCVRSSSMTVKVCSNSKTLRLRWSCTSMERSGSGTLTTAIVVNSASAAAIAAQTSSGIPTAASMAMACVHRCGPGEVQRCGFWGGH